MYWILCVLYRYILYLTLLLSILLCYSLFVFSVILLFYISFYILYNCVSNSLCRFKVSMKFYFIFIRLQRSKIKNVIKTWNLYLRTSIRKEVLCWYKTKELLPRSGVHPAQRASRHQWARLRAPLKPQWGAKGLRGPSVGPPDADGKLQLADETRAIYITDRQRFFSSNSFQIEEYDRGDIFFFWLWT